MKAAIEQVFNGSLAQVALGGAYDPTKINRGKHTGQFNLGSGETDKFIGPSPAGVANLAESSLAIPSQFVHPVKISDDLFWIFGSDVATAAATRRVQLWTWVPSTNTYTFIGAITCTFPTWPSSDPRELHDGNGRCFRNRGHRLRNGLEHGSLSRVAHRLRID